MGKFKLYIDYFKNKLFPEKTKIESEIDPDEVLIEVWQADFSNPKKARFQEETGDGYVANFKTNSGKNYFSIKALRKHIYAWTVNKFFRHKNFVLETKIIMPLAKEKSETKESGRAGNYAAGIFFRYINDSTFYALLISDYGWIRLDAMANGTPMPVVGWTKPVEAISKDSIDLQIIAINSKITVLVNKNWLFSAENDIIQAAGKTAFAVQNWDVFPNVEFSLERFSIASKPIVVEAADTDANQKGSKSPEAHINLAKTYFAMGHYVPALVELKTALGMRPPTQADYIFAGKIYFAQKMYSEAEESFIKAIEYESKTGTSVNEAIIELGGIYYHNDNFSKLEKLLQPLTTEELKAAPLLANLKGHLMHYKKEFLKAAEFYGMAFDSNPNMGSFAYYKANELIAANKNEEAIDWYIKAGKSFLKAEQYNDLVNVITNLERLSPESDETLVLTGKFYYATEQYSKALDCFQKLCHENEIQDASSWYLYGLLIKAQDTKTALNAFKKAYQLEPNEGLYCFRFAEAQFFNGDNCSKTLEKALKLDPQNAWTHNLAALKAINENNLELANKEIKIARNILPDELDLLANYVEIKRLEGKLNECIPLFDIKAGTADSAVEKNRGKAYHELANALYADENFDLANDWYNKALKVYPKDTILMTNKAQNCLEIGLLNEAEDLLVKSIDIKPSVDIYRTLSYVASEKGTFTRSIAVLQEGLALFKNNADMLFELAILQNKIGNVKEAEITLQTLMTVENSERVKNLAQKIKNI